jgi:hypothetical protein
MFGARRGPRYQAGLATSVDAAAAQPDYSDESAFWGGRCPVIPAADMDCSAQSCASNPIGAPYSIQVRVGMDAPRYVVAHLAASVLILSVLKVSVYI